MEPDKKVSVAEMTALIILGLLTDIAILAAIVLLLVPVVGEVFGALVAAFKFIGDVVLFFYFWKRTGQLGKNAFVQGILALVESYGIPTTTLSIIAGILMANNPKIAALLSFLDKKKVLNVKNAAKNIDQAP